MRGRRFLRLLRTIIRPLPESKDWMEMVNYVFTGLLATLGVTIPVRLFGTVGVAITVLVVALILTGLAAYRLLTRLEPALSVECKTDRDRHGGREARALLKVQNMGTEPIRNAYAKIARVIEREVWTHTGSPYISEREIYENQDIFLRWQATEDRRHSFHTSAILSVAKGRSGDGGYGLSVSGELSPGLQTGTWYEVVIEIAADNVATLTTSYGLKMDNPVHRNSKGELVLYIDLPYEVKFREWDKSMMPSIPDKEETQLSAVP